MKKSLLVFALLICSNTLFLKAQNVNVNWSEKLIYDNKLDGFFEEFVGENSKLIFARFDNMVMSKKKKEKSKKINLIGFDKNTMKKVCETVLVDSKNKESVKKYEGLKYYKTIVFENTVYVFWMKESKTKDELFVQSFDNKLKKAQSLKKIYELNSSKEDKKKAELFVMSNKAINETIIIGGELAAQKGKNIIVEYKVLKSDLTFAAAHQVELPIVASYKSDQLSSGYEFGDDGNLHIKTYVSMTKEQMKNAQKGESYRYPLYSIVEVESGKIQTYSMKFDNKNIFDFDFLVTKNSIKLFGFFCDLSKDTKGYKTHGIFYALLDPKTFQLSSDLNFSYFSKSQLDDLFSNDEDKFDRNANTKKKKKKKSNDDDESLVYNYNIELAQAGENNSIVLFCSIMHNYSVTTCDSKGNCHTSYYCNKRNVTLFKINSEGKMEWASNLDRAITYSGWYIYDLRVKSLDNKYFVSYGSAYSINADKKNRKTRKKGKYVVDRFEYAIFDAKTGKFTKNEYKVNPINAKKEDKKYISPTEITVYDNELYVNSERVKVKGWAIAVGCTGALVCPPVMLIPFMSGWARKGTGNLGHIEVTK